MLEIVQAFVIQTFEAEHENEELHMSAMTADLPFAGTRPAPRRVTTDVPLRLTPRGRAVVFLLALGLGLAGMLGNQVANAGTAAPAVPVDTYTVRAGETLWDIAVGLAGPGEDVRDVVADLIDLNGLPGAALRAGQQVLLPAEG